MPRKLNMRIKNIRSSKFYNHDRNMDNTRKMLNPQLKDFEHDAIGHAFGFHWPVSRDTCSVIYVFNSRILCNIWCAWIWIGIVAFEIKRTMNTSMNSTLHLDICTKFRFLSRLKYSLTRYAIFMSIGTPISKYNHEHPVHLLQHSSNWQCMLPYFSWFFRLYTSLFACK